MAPSSSRELRLGALARTCRPAPTSGAPAVTPREPGSGPDALPGGPLTRDEGTLWRVEEFVPHPSAAASEAAPEVCFDLETCGFQGTPLFLVGLLTAETGGFRLTQLLARHYGEERAVVAETRERLAGFPKWLSFNGKAYDAPFLAARAGLHGWDLPQPENHRDLLHEARRRYRHELPDCRLQTLESLVLKRFRAGDVPGREIPGLYHEAVRAGRPERLRPVLEHNRHDLVTLALLADHLTEPDDCRTGVGLTVRVRQG